MQHQFTTDQIESPPINVMEFPRPQAVATLTPRGDAMIALYRFERVLKTLDATDRAYVLDDLRAMLAEVCDDR